MTQKLSLTLTASDGKILDKWTSDDLGDRSVFDRLAATEEISKTTSDRIQNSYGTTYWIKDTRTYLIKADTEADALEIYNGDDFDDDWSNHDVEVGFEI